MTTYTFDKNTLLAIFTDAKLEGPMSDFFKDNFSFSNINLNRNIFREDQKRKSISSSLDDSKNENRVAIANYTQDIIKLNYQILQQLFSPNLITEPKSQRAYMKSDNGDIIITCSSNDFKMTNSNVLTQKPDLIKGPITSLFKFNKKTHQFDLISISTTDSNIANKFRIEAIKRDEFKDNDNPKAKMINKLKNQILNIYNIGGQHTKLNPLFEVYEAFKKMDHSDKSKEECLKIIKKNRSSEPSSKPSGWIGWLQSFFTPRQTPAENLSDRTVKTLLDELEKFIRSSPTQIKRWNM